MGTEWRAFRHPIRDFTFWDGRETGQSVLVDIRGGAVARIRGERGGAEIDLLRLGTGIGRQHLSGAQRGSCPGEKGGPARPSGQRPAGGRGPALFEHSGVDLRDSTRCWPICRPEGRPGRQHTDQQLVKNFILTPERSLWRKANEALMALMVDARYSKDEILEAYANEIFLGREGGRAIHGFGLGAYFYFNRPLNELRLHEAALLVGLVKGHRSTTHGDIRNARWKGATW